MNESNTIPWRSDTDHLLPIATRLPAGLTEDELEHGYALCGGGAS